MKRCALVTCASRTSGDLGIQGRHPLGSVVFAENQEWLHVQQCVEKKAPGVFFEELEEDRCG